MTYGEKIEYRKLENVAAITAEIFAADAFVDFYTEAYDGNSALFNFIIEAAKSFSYNEQFFGEPNEDFDWVLAIEAYSRNLIVNWEHADTNRGREVLAKRALWLHRENKTRYNPNLTADENEGIFSL